jgi:pyruvate dehydrogenase (quinone)
VTGATGRRQTGRRLTQAAARVFDSADRVTILAGAGSAGAHQHLLELAGTLKAPVLHAFRGKEFVEYDHPFDVGVTGLIGFSSGYRAMEDCNALLMLGTDFPYRAFYPEGVLLIQVDTRGEQIGRRVPVDVPLVGTVKDTTDALRPLITPKTDTAHLDGMTAHYRRDRHRWRSSRRRGILRRSHAIVLAQPARIAATQRSEHGPEGGEQ